MTLSETDLKRFVARLQERLEVGAREYGDSSFIRPLPELLSEIADELVDVAGWGVILWARVERLRELVERLDAAGGSDG